MAAVAELTLLEKSLGLSKRNKYSAHGERQVRGRDGAERQRVDGNGAWECGLTGRGGRGGDAAPQLPTCLPRGAGWRLRVPPCSPSSGKEHGDGLGRKFSFC